MPLYSGVVMELIIHGDDVESIETLILDRLADALVDEAFFELSLHLFAVALGDDGFGCFAGPVTGEADFLGKGGQDGVLMFGDFISRHSDVSDGAAVWLMFNVDIHGERRQNDSSSR